VKTVEVSARGTVCVLERASDGAVASVELVGRGVTDYSFDEAWRDYRLATAYLMVLPVITLMGWDSMPERSKKLSNK